MLKGTFKPLLFHAFPSLYLFSCLIFKSLLFGLEKDAENSLINNFKALNYLGRSELQPSYQQTLLKK